MKLNLISFKIDAEKGEGVQLRETFEVTAYPTFIYLGTNGQVLKKQICPTILAGRATCPLPSAPVTLGGWPRSRLEQTPNVSNLIKKE